jgi:hypothetical protein
VFLGFNNSPADSGHPAGCWSNTGRTNYVRIRGTDASRHKMIRGTMNSVEGKLFR